MKQYNKYSHFHNGLGERIPNHPSWQKDRDKSMYWVIAIKMLFWGFVIWFITMSVMLI